MSYRDVVNEIIGVGIGQSTKAKVVVGSFTVSEIAERRRPRCSS